ncbi:pirin family protein [Comamonas sp. NLF-1-9]|uniref:pirin family protein n=1 Tax=Comamonas sp. NLF-1-9 TaxID=2853163 RepID=UPI001C469FA5|nr:pirin family protein [Comamonas sp. NLF-1-9]QXL85450.1 pirin family protein [Comamonas sp. NLF-1-9]
MKHVEQIWSTPRGHWVGDGFPVRTLFNYNQHAPVLSPFLMLDYGGPVQFQPTEARRGVGEHPHRGFETVTIVFDGEVEHLDSTGRGGTIGPGDVQWMTAASGILHEEFHGREWARKGGKFEMAQLWVNLPAKDKRAAPGYQGITAAQIPTVALANGAGSARIIAGELDGQRGPARSFTPMHVWDVRLKAGCAAELPLPEGWTGALVVLQGRIDVDGTEAADAQTVHLSRAGSAVALKALEETHMLVLSGQPIDEPIAAYGPFVMNTEAEIRQAFIDLQAGHFGEMPRAAKN